MVGTKRATRRDVLNYISNYFMTTDIVVVNEFETLRARHVCPGGRIIWLLEKFVLPVPVGYETYINVELFRCQCCGKVIVNRNSLDMY